MAAGEQWSRSYQTTSAPVRGKACTCRTPSTPSSASSTATASPVAARRSGASNRTRPAASDTTCSRGPSSGTGWRCRALVTTRSVLVVVLLDRARRRRLLAQPLAGLGDDVGGVQPDPLGPGLGGPRDLQPERGDRDRGLVHGP